MPCNRLQKMISNWFGGKLCLKTFSLSPSNSLSKVFHPTLDNIEISSSQNQKVNMNKFMKSSRGVAEPIRDTGSCGSYSSKTQEE